MINKIDELDALLDVIDDMVPVQEIYNKEPILDTPSDKEDLSVLAGRLEQWNKSCRDLFIDMGSLGFRAEEEDMCLFFKEKEFYSKEIFFKRDPDNPKDPKLLHALKQFCTVLGVPLPFFLKNRPTLRANIVRTWQAGLAAEKSEKNQYIARIRESDSMAMLRALVPVTYCSMSNYQLINILKEQVPGIHLDYVSGDDRDDINLHVRCLFNEKFMLFGETPVRLGFSLLCSELGGGPLVVEVLLHQIEGELSFIASYGTDSFFSSKYKGMQAQDIKDMFPRMIDRITNERAEMLTVVEKAYRPIDPEDEALKICRWGGLPPGFKKTIFHEVSECEDDMRTTWDFARHIAMIAKGLDTTKRIKLEKVAGKYLNLVFPRS